MSYYVYMLKNINSFKSKTYVGFTNNISNRLDKHNNNKGAKSTRGYKWIVIYKKRFISKNKALSYEYTLKKDRKLRISILNEFKKK